MGALFPFVVSQSSPMSSLSTGRISDQWPKARLAAVPDAKPCDEETVQNLGVNDCRTERQCQRKGSRDGLSRPIEVAGRRGASGTGHLHPQVLDGLWPC
jgi:hypothetical protein